jgi:hypothetical protein
LSNSDDWNDRRFRHDVEIAADVHYPGGHSNKSVISNLSLEGCCLIGWFRIGDSLELTIPGIGRTRGRVRWAVGGQAGIRFLSRTELDGEADQSAFS